MLRFDVDNPTQAAPGNMTGGNPHIWDYGLRNPWRFSFDRDTGDLYIGDVGQGAWEEVDVEAKGTGHKNYGWKVAEGNHCRPGEAGCDRPMSIRWRLRSTSTRTAAATTASSAASCTAAARSRRSRAGTSTATTARAARSARSCGTATGAAPTRRSS